MLMVRFGIAAAVAATMLTLPAAAQQRPQI